MADNGLTIDTLSVEIESDATRANKEIDGVVSSLENLAEMLEKIETKIGKKVEFKGFDKVAKNADIIGAKFKDLGKKFEFHGNTEQAQKALRNYQNLLEKAKLKKEELEMSGKTGGKAYQDAIRDIAKYENIIEKLKAKAAEPLPLFSPDLEAKLAKMEEAADKVNETLASDDTPRFGKELEQNMIDANKVFDTSIQKLQKLEELALKFKDLGLDFTPQGDLKTSQKELAKLEKQIVEINDKLEIEVNAGGTEKTIERLAAQLSQATNKADKLRAHIEQLKNANVKINVETENIAPISNTETIKNLSKLQTFINAIQDKFKTLASRGNALFVDKGIKQYTARFKGLQNEINATEKSMAALNSQLSRSRSGSGKYKQLQKEIEALKIKLDELRTKENEMQLNGSAFMLNDKGISAFTSSFKRAWNSFKPFEKIKKSISQFFKKFASTGKKTQGFISKLATTAKMMLRFTIIFQAFRAITESITYGYKNLVVYSSKINQQVSNLVNNLNQLKNTFAAMTWPAFAQLEPLLDRLIQKVIDLMNVVNQFLSALSGAQTFIHAKKLTDSYADSVKGLNKQLRAFDELNNLTTNNGSSQTNPKDMFEDLPIETKIKNYADKFKNLWKDTNLTNIGSDIGNSISKGLKNIKWNDVKATVNNVSKRLVTLVNGIVQADKLGYTIGASLGEAINTAFEGLHEFVSKFDFASLGKQIAEGFNGLFEKVDFKLIKNTVVKGIEGIANTVNGFADHFDFDNISKVVVNGFDIVSDAILTACENIKWKEIAAKLGEQFAKTIRETNWYQVGEALGAATQTALDSLEAFVKQLSFSDIVKAIKDTFKGFAEKADMTEIATIFITLLATKMAVVAVKVSFSIAALKIAQRLGAALLGSESVASLAGSVGSLFGKMGTQTSVLTAVEALGKTLGFKIIAGLSAALAGWNLGQKIYELYSGEKIDKSFTEQMSEIGKSFTDGSWKGALKLWGSDIKNTIWKDSVKETAKVATESKKNIDNYYSAFENGLPKIERATKTIDANLNVLSNTAKYEKVGQNITEGILNPLSNPDTNKASQAFKTKLIGNLRTEFDSHSPARAMYPLGGDIVAGICEGMTLNMTAIDKASSKIQDIFKASFKGLSSTMSVYGNNAAIGFANGLTKALSNIKIASQNLADTVKNKIKDALNIHSPSKVTYDLGAFTGEGFLDGFESMFGPIQKSLSNFAFDVSSGLSNITPSLTSDVTNYTTVPTTSNITQTLTNSNASTDAILSEILGAIRSGNTIIEINGREVFQAVRNEERKEYKSTGRHVFA